MEIRIDREERRDPSWGTVIAMTITLLVAREEYAAIQYANAWQKKPLGKFTLPTGTFSTVTLQPKFFELLTPGILIPDVATYTADSLETKFRERCEPALRQEVSTLLRKFMLDHRDAAFRPPPLGPIIDVTPGGSVPSAALSGAGAPYAPTAPFGMPPFFAPSAAVLDAPRRIHSAINIFDFVKERIAPRAIESLSSLPPAQKLQYWFDKPQGNADMEVRFYMVFPPEAVEVIKRWDLHKAVIATEPMFDQDAIDKVKELQEAELSGTGDQHLRACRAIEHKEQLEFMREAKHELTLLDYAAFPYRVKCEHRYEASRVQKRLEGTFNKIRDLLNEHRDR